MTEIIKSTITCDMEGRIETFNKGAEEIFRYRPEEVIGKKRVSLFSPGLVVLEHVPTWLKIASEKGEYKGRTVFLRKDGTAFAADVRITPTFREGKQTGFCGVTEPRPDIDVNKAYPQVALVTKIFGALVVTRAPFLTASLVPVLIGAAWVAARGLAPAFPWGLFWLVVLGASALHVAANTFNDYFDWTSGTDQANNNYFLPYSGGSRSIELGLISERGLFRLASISLAVAVAAGLAVMFVTGRTWLLAFGAFGAFSAYFYTAPPLRLAARRGLGELLIGLNFGPLMVAGTVYALTGHVTWLEFLAGLPIGLLTTAILWINQFPDLESDRDTGKVNLVVVLGRERARWGYALLLAGAFGLVTVGVALRWFPPGALALLLSLPVALYTTRHLFQHYADRTLVKANATTINLHVLAGLLMAMGIFVGAMLG
jgi:1,4-dihydroxy-2-naphthoate octaprenyltransferase